MVGVVISLLLGIVVGMLLGCMMAGRLVRMAVNEMLNDIDARIRSEGEATHAKQTSEPKLTMWE